MGAPPQGTRPLTLRVGRLKHSPFKAQGPQPHATSVAEMDLRSMYQGLS